jgi:hypothetical protein
MAAFRKVSEDQTDFQSLVKNDVYSFDEIIDLEWMNFFIRSPLLTKINIY